MPEYEYLSIISPPEQVCNNVANEKNSFSYIYQAPSAKYSKPHITLAHFVQDDRYEKLIVNSLTATALRTAAFPVVLKDFGNFPSHCIYINVINKMPFRSLTVRIRKSFKKIPKPRTNYKSSFINDPHLTIARGLEPSQYEDSWAAYSQKKYEGNFMAKNMLLLKRPMGTMKYEVAGRFEFTGLPGDWIQLPLFK